MSRRIIPDWFTLAEDANPKIMQRLSAATERLNLPVQVAALPRQALWFLMNSVYMANLANREGMHANALSITRQCLEAISIIELGLAQTPDASQLLRRWESDSASAGELRKWLEQNVWPGYGAGLWSEPWPDFMGKLCKAIQPYAHYSPMLAQWQGRLHQIGKDPDGGYTAVLECGPRTYDPQKATRITLFHSLVGFALARVWIANHRSVDLEFESLIEQLRDELGKSRYLDGNQTNWDQQFWAMLWFADGDHCPE
jgi:hypothetical protein